MRWIDISTAVTALGGYFVIVEIISRLHNVFSMYVYIGAVIIASIAIAVSHFKKTMVLVHHKIIGAFIHHRPKEYMAVLYDSVFIVFMAAVFVAYNKIIEAMFPDIIPAQIPSLFASEPQRVQYVVNTSLFFGLIAGFVILALHLYFKDRVWKLITDHDVTLKKRTKVTLIYMFISLIITILIIAMFKTLAAAIILIPYFILIVFFNSYVQCAVTSRRGFKKTIRVAAKAFFTRRILIAFLWFVTGFELVSAIADQVSRYTPQMVAVVIVTIFMLVYYTWIRISIYRLYCQVTQ